MNHIVVPILDIIKAHPEWAMVLIAPDGILSITPVRESALSGDCRARGGEG
jgi:hypothetical protein